MTSTDPHAALRDMPSDRLLSNFVANIESELHRGALGMGPTTVAMRMEILRRMTDGGRR